MDLDPEHQRALITVLIGGIVVMAIGSVTLYYVFRGFGKAPGSSAHFGLMAALIAFVFACCLGLLFVAYRAH